MSRIFTTTVRFNLDREADRQALQYLQGIGRQVYRTGNQAVIAALNDHFNRLENQANDTQEKEDAFLKRVLLDAKCRSLAPRDAESEWPLAFTRAMAERDDAAFGISMLTTGTPQQQADYIQTHREVINHYERELESHRRSRPAGIRESPVRRDESAGADAAG